MVFALEYLQLVASESTFPVVLCYALKEASGGRRAYGIPVQATGMSVLGEQLISTVTEIFPCVLEDISLFTAHFLMAVSIDTEGNA